MAPPLVQVDPEREEADLRAYLGDRYDVHSLRTYEETLEREFEACENEARFYRTSNAYLYNLTAFAMTLTKLPYLRELCRAVPPESRVLDYGCGIGSDGLALMDAGYEVEFADFANPSTEYLRWRLDRRGFKAPVHDLDRGVPGGFDAAFSFDVIEHVDDPWSFIGELEARAQVVVVNFLEPEPGETALHRHLPIRRLLSYVAQRRLVFYGVVHGRSHLVVWNRSRVGLRATVRQRLAMRQARRRGCFLRRRA